ncbi:hypothetical protein EJ06DRAFT_521332 [Trichodelitschia bisporula]|uniref:Retrovirus-related Pol polyprotein from transposon TNT 1-94-like beta-barrel domain-containing protein n=1 Tax=Trichodelitschia bisporula TaxID=703511 RepID=A0A6G1HXM5_9PEZI|nr:hypothetical protein EJ06DRAFT_521332 [Trichodelitschia bisporula]
MLPLAPTASWDPDVLQGVIRLVPSFGGSESSNRVGVGFLNNSGSSALTIWDHEEETLGLDRAAFPPIRIMRVTELGSFLLASSIRWSGKRCRNSTIVRSAKFRIRSFDNTCENVKTARSIHLWTSNFAKWSKAVETLSRENKVMAYFQPGRTIYMMFCFWAVFCFYLASVYESTAPPFRPIFLGLPPSLTLNYVKTNTSVRHSSAVSLPVCEDWVYASDSEVHVATQRQWFVDFKPIDSTAQCPKGTVHVAGIGTVELKVQTEAFREGTLYLTSVLYIPELPINIIGQPILVYHNVVTPQGLDSGGFTCNMQSTNVWSSFRPGYEVYLLNLAKAPAGTSRLAHSIQELVHAFEDEYGVDWPDSEREKWAPIGPPEPGQILKLGGHEIRPRPQNTNEQQRKRKRARVRRYRKRKAEKKRSQQYERQSSEKQQIKRESSEEPQIKQECPEEPQIKKEGIEEQHEREDAEFREIRAVISQFGLPLPYAYTWQTHTDVGDHA